MPYLRPLTQHYLRTLTAPTKLVPRSRDTVDDMVTTLVFGVITTVVALVGIVVAVLQLRHMAQRRLKDSIFELA
jgi:hypothetical protein